MYNFFLPSRRGQPWSEVVSQKSLQRPMASGSIGSLASGFISKQSHQGQSNACQNLQLILRIMMQFRSNTVLFAMKLKVFFKNPFGFICFAPVKTTIWNANYLRTIHLRLWMSRLMEKPKQFCTVFWRSQEKALIEVNFHCSRLNIIFK